MAIGVKTLKKTTSDSKPMYVKSKPKPKVKKNGSR